MTNDDEKLLGLSLAGKLDEETVRSEMGWESDGHIYVYFAYNDPDRAPVIDTADGPTEALYIAQRADGVMYRYEDDGTGKLKGGSIVSVEELRNLIGK